MNKIKLICMLCFLVFGVAAFFTNNGFIPVVQSYSSQPPPQMTGAPGEQNCSLCHDDPGTGTITITAPANYVPGQIYQIQVQHATTDVTRQRWGFEMTALDGTNSGAGTFSHTSPFTQSDSADGRDYVEHTSSGTFAGTGGGATWTFNWNAPATNLGPVTFYAAGNQANNNNNPNGDHVFLTTTVSNPAGPTPTNTATPTATPTGACPTRITHSLSQTITSGNSVACGNNSEGHEENSYWREFSLSGFNVGAGQTYNITSVDVGIETANAVGAIQPVNIRLYANPTGAAPHTWPGTLTPIGNVTAAVSDQTGTVLTVPFTASITNIGGSMSLVMEVNTLDSRPTPGDWFLIGSNGNGQTAPSYFSSAFCVFPYPINLAAINPGVHIVMNVNGSCAPAPSISGTITYGNAIGNPVPPRLVRNVSVASTVGSPTVGPVITGTPGTYTLTGFGAGSYTIKPTKSGGANTAVTSNDAARVAQGVSASVPFVSLNQKFASDASGNGTVSSNDAALIARFAAGLTGTGNVGQWRFFTANLPGPPTGPLPTPPYNDSRTYASVTSNVTGDDYVALLIGEASGNYNPATHPRPGTVVGGQLSVVSEDGGGPERGGEAATPITIAAQHLVSTADKEIVIPVSVNGVAGKEIISYEFNLTYDPAVIQPMESPVDLAGTVSRGLMVVTNPIEPGLLRVVVYGPMPIDGDGVLLNLRFTAVGTIGLVSPLAFEKVMFNEGEMQLIIENGELIIEN